MSNEKKNMLIGESSWDLICFKKFENDISSYYLHNDYFFYSNKRNTRIIYRLKTIIKTLVYAINAICKNQKIYFSSLNFEVLVVAFVLAKYKQSYIFIPNVIGNPGCYSKLFNLVLNNYRKKIFVTDIITNSTLKKFGTNLIRNHFSFNLPKQNEYRSLHYIVVFPASNSHKKTKTNAHIFNHYILKVYKYLHSLNLKVYALMHPRDAEYMNNELDDVNVIESSKIRNLGSSVFYISACSSLSLNRRYGGKYGCWVSFNAENGLVDSLSFYQKDLINLESFISC